MISAWEHKEHLKKIAETLDCSDLAREVLDHPQFEGWSASSKPHKHHYGRGKLIEHTREVVDLCLQTNSYFAAIGKGVNEKHLFLAALFHDFGKLWDYESTGYDDKEVWKANDHKNLIHHIPRGAILWSEAHRKQRSWSRAMDDEILHAILSHHGLKEWGSPVQPQTRLAWILHLCDGMSARMDDCDKRKPFSNEAKSE